MSICGQEICQLRDSGNSNGGGVGGNGVYGETFFMPRDAPFCRLTTTFDSLVPGDRHSVAPVVTPRAVCESLAAEMMSPYLAVPSHSSLIAVEKADQEKPLIYATAYCWVTSRPCPFTTSLNSSGLSKGSSRSSSEKAAVFCSLETNSRSCSRTYIATSG